LKHTHWLVVGRPDQHFREFHPGYRAKWEAQEAYKKWAGDPKKKPVHSDVAYKRAMGDWQDGINRAVGMKLGHLREGPREKRISQREQSILNEAKKKANSVAEGITKTAEAQAQGILETAERGAATIRASAEKREAAVGLREKKQDERERAFEEGQSLVTGNKEFDLPGVLDGEYKNLPIIGEVFKATYFDRVKNFISGLMKELGTLIKENRQEKKNLQELKKKMENSAARLDGQYGEAKEFEAWRAIRNAQKPPEKNQGVRRN